MLIGAVLKTEWYPSQNCALMLRVERALGITYPLRRRLIWRKQKPRTGFLLAEIVLFHSMPGNLLNIFLKRMDHMFEKAWQTPYVCTTV